MSLSVLNGFLIFSIIQSFILAGLFYSKKQRIKADLIMVTFLLLFAVHSFLILLNLNNSKSGFFNILPVSLTLLYGPLLFLYVHQIISEKKRRKVKQVWHYIPFLFFFFLSFFLYKAEIFLKIIAVSGVVSGLTYCLFTYSVLKKHRINITERFSYVEKINLNWVKRLVTGLLFIWSGVLILVFLSRILNMTVSLNWFFICIPVFISYLGYYGLKQQVIYDSFQEENPEKKETNHNGSSKQKEYDNYTDNKLSYKKSGLQTSDMVSIFNLLQDIMHARKLYQQSTLSLKELSEKSNIPQHHITQTLNEYAKKNFYDFVNSYRVDEFKERLKQGDAGNFSLLGIAFDCGFNSKSSFNRIFKNITGFSPSEYKKTL